MGRYNNNDDTNNNEKIIIRANKSEQFILSFYLTGRETRKTRANNLKKTKQKGKSNAIKKGVISSTIAI